jgi:hypothetical protein
MYRLARRVSSFEKNLFSHLGQTVTKKIYWKYKLNITKTNTYANFSKILMKDAG